MAELFTATFPGSALPGTMSSDHRNGGSHVVSGGTLTVTGTSAANSVGAVRQTAAVTMADGDTVSIRLVSAGSASETALILRTGSGDTPFLASASVNSGGNWTSRIVRLGSGVGTVRATGASAASQPWLRFRRSGATLVLGTAPDVSGSPGSFTALDTFVDADALWDAVWTAVQVEVATFGNASTVISRLGVSSLLSTDLQLRFTAGALSVDSAVMPVAAGGGGSLVFRSRWDTALGNSEAAVRDTGGDGWDTLFCGVGTVAEVIANTGLGWTRTPNVLRMTQRGAPCAQVEVANVVPASTTHWGRFYFRDDESGTGYTHFSSYPALGSLELAIFARYAQPGGGQRHFINIYFGATYPHTQWSIGVEGVSGVAELPRGVWYRYEWEFRYITPTTYRIFPRIYSMAGTLLFSEASFFRADYPGSGHSLQTYYDAGNSFVVNDTARARTYGHGNHGPPGGPNNGESIYTADLAFSTAGWIGDA
jgi:hypothetical protein